MDWSFGPSSAPDALYVSPTGSDQGAQIAGLANTYAHKRRIVLLPGTYLISTTIRLLQSGAVIECAPGVQFNLQVGQRSPGPPSPYLSLVSIENQTTPLSSTTLALAVKPAQGWALLTGALAGDGHALKVGDTIGIQAAGGGQQWSSAVAGGYFSTVLSGHVFTVEGPYTGTFTFTLFGGAPQLITLSATSAAGTIAAINAAAGKTIASFDIDGMLILNDPAGPIALANGTGDGAAAGKLGIAAGWAVALDRRSLYPGSGNAGFPATTTGVIKFLQLRDCAFLGDGGGKGYKTKILPGSISERIGTFAGTRECKIAGLYIPSGSSFDEYWFSCGDVLSAGNLIEEIEAEGANSSVIAVEGNDGATVRRVRYLNSLASGVGQNPVVQVNQYARGVRLEDLWINGQYGLSGAGLLVDVGCQDIVVEGGLIASCANAAVIKGQRVSFDGTAFRNSTGSNLVITSTAGNVVHYGGENTGAGQLDSTGYGVTVDTATGNGSYGTYFSGNASGPTNLTNAGTFTIGALS